MAKRAKPQFEYATEFDKAMNGRPLTKQHALYGRGLSNGFAIRENFA